MIPTVQFLRENGRRRLLDSAGSDFQVRALEADLLLSHLLGVSRLSLIAKNSEPVSTADQEAFGLLIERRRRGEPVAYILGQREFYGRDFIVSPAVLIPRPETEVIVERALAQFSEGAGPNLLIDAGTGSGAIVLSILAELRHRFGETVLNNTTAIALDISTAALAVAQANCALLRLEPHVRFVQSDLFEAAAVRAELVRPGYSLRVVVSNPPYIPESEMLPPDVGDFEPELALRAGPDGLSVIRRLIEALEPELKKDLRLLVECGIGQARAIDGLLRSGGIVKTSILRDLAGIDRVVGANLI